MASTSDEKSFTSQLCHLTLQEKVSLLSGNSFNTSPGVPRLNIPVLKVADSINGVRPDNPMDGDGTTACFPCTSCLASTWDAELLGRLGEELAHQAKVKNADVVLGPTINIHRDPRAGRNFECFSEDPLLSGQLAGAIVNGIQKHGIGACAKHFVCNDSETLRHYYDVKESTDSRTLREIYLAAWQHLLRVSDPIGVMTAYNKVDGTFCSEHNTLVEDILRQGWKYPGLIMSDWFGTHSTVAPIKAGLDLEMPFPVFRGAKLVEEVKSGAVTEAELDQRVLKMLELRDWLETRKDGKSAGSGNGKASQVARELAQSGLVLLKNEENALPLSPSKDLKVAVIGEFATAAVVTGGGSASCKPQYRQRPLDFLQEAFTTIHAPGVRTRRIIPLAPTSQLVAPSGAPGVDVSYFNDTAPTTPVLTEHLPTPNVFMLGSFKPGLDVPGSRFELTTTLTPLTTGHHTLAVRCTGAFTLTLDNNSANPILSRDADPPLTTEQFLFNPTALELRSQPLHMVAGQKYALRLTVHAREKLIQNEPTPYAAALGFEEEYPVDKAIAKAVDAARQADVSVVFCGRSEQYESEGFDLQSVKMPEEQARMIRAVAEAGKKTVLVLYAGNMIDLEEVGIEKVDAVVLAHFPGQEGAAAVVDVLTGRVNPSGRLATTWWARGEDAPSWEYFPAKKVKGPGGEETVEIKYAEGLKVGYRAPGAEEKARWPFGFGLSYTSFGYDGLRADVRGGKVRCEVAVTNTGKREGKETVQLYVRPAKEQSVWRPERELKGFAKVSLQPGERKVVELEVDVKIACSYWDEGERAWRMESGTYEVQVANCKGAFTVEKSEVWSHL